MEGTLHQHGGLILLPKSPKMTAKKEKKRKESNRLVFPINVE